MSVFYCLVSSEFHESSMSRLWMLMFENKTPIHTYDASVTCIFDLECLLLHLYEGLSLLHCF